MSNLHPGIAQRYTRSIFNITSNTSEIKSLISELQLLYDNISIIKNLWSYLCSKWIAPQEKLSIINNVSHILKLSQLTKAIATILINNHRLFILNEIIKQLKMELSNIENYIQVEINSAVVLDIKTKKTIQNKLKNIFNLNIKAEFKVDPSVIGGFIIYGDSIMLDLSFKGRINYLKRSFNMI
jgi:F-type H+-transporting ATPase subunit delta